MEENNKLIAEFIGFVESPTTNKYWTKRSSEGFGIGELVDLKFDSDWNWLMQVVEKIDEVCGLDLHEWDEHINNALCSKSLHTTYNACVEFIKWYNQNK
jgi:hypothetical protein